MKITATQYAKGLYEMTEGKTPAEIDVVLLGFAKTLKKNKQLKLKKNIIQDFTAIYNQEKGIVLAEIISREKLDDVIVSKTRKFLQAKYAAKEVAIENKIDENIKGGIIIKVGDEVLDWSLVRQLKNLHILLSK